MTFFVVERRVGPDWNPALPMEEQPDWDAHAEFMDALVDDRFVVLGGPLEDEVRVVLVVEADSKEAVRERLAQDPWHEQLLVVESVDRWTIRLDGR